MSRIRKRGMTRKLGELERYGMVALLGAFLLTLAYLHEELRRKGAPRKAERFVASLLHGGTQSWALRRPGGSLARGEPADLVLVDPQRRWTYDPAKGYSKSRNSPWAGRALEGRAVSTFVGGRCVYDVERIVAALKGQ